jgi:hypothetical protein
MIRSARQGTESSRVLYETSSTIVTDRVGLKR